MKPPLGDFLSDTFRFRPVRSGDFQSIAQHIVDSGAEAMYRRWSGIVVMTRYAVPQGNHSEPANVLGLRLRGSGEVGWRRGRRAHRVMTGC